MLGWVGLGCSETHAIRQGTPSKDGTEALGWAGLSISGTGVAGGCSPQIEHWGFALG